MWLSCRHKSMKAHHLEHRIHKVLHRQIRGRESHEIVQETGASKPLRGTGGVSEGPRHGTLPVALKTESDQESPKQNLDMRMVFQTVLQVGRTPRLVDLCPANILF